MEIETMLTAAAELMRQLAPETYDLAPYLLAHPAGWPEPDAAAYTTIGRDIRLRDYLTAYGKWQGWKPAIVFVAMPPNDLDFFGLFLHELSHALPVVELPDVEPKPAERERQEQFVANWTASRPIDNAIPWKGHGRRWHRRLLHLHHRALWTGLVLPLTTLGAGMRYGLSETDKYLSALGSEPFDLRNYPFAEINAMPAPKSFTELFESDCAKYEQKKLFRSNANASNT